MFKRLMIYFWIKKNLNNFIKKSIEEDGEAKISIRTRMVVRKII